MIGGLDYPDSGSVTVDGIELQGMRERQLAVFRRSKIGFIYQSYNLIPSLTVQENISVFCKSGETGCGLGIFSGDYRVFKVG